MKIDKLTEQYAFGSLKYICKSEHCSTYYCKTHTHEFYEFVIVLSKKTTHYINENKYQLRKEVEIIAEYFPESETEYLVRCAVKERTSTLMEIKLNVVTKEQAITICDNWKNNSSSVYESLLQQLMFDSSKQNQSTTQ